MRLALVVIVVASSACGRAATRAVPEPRPAARAAKLPEGVSIVRCSDRGDLDGDGFDDEIVLVTGSSEESDQARGLAILWGSGAEATVIGAGQRLRVVEFGDTTRTTARADGVEKDFDADLTWLMGWDILDVYPDPRGGRLLRARDRGIARTFDFLPGVHGDGLRLDGGDAAWVLWRTAGGDWYWAPLGY